MGDQGISIKNLIVSAEGKKIIDDLSLEIEPGKVQALMGPNGSGKSTLSFAIMGHPGYKIEGGQVLLDGEDITEMAPDERARKGIFLSFQYPSAVPGVTLANFLRLALNSRRDKDDPIPLTGFRKVLEEKMKLLKMDPVFARRYINDGFSGGEKKRSEILQMALLQPAFAILDETDSGLDIDALRIVSEGINTIKADAHSHGPEGVPDPGILLITHYQRILRYVKPDIVHVMVKGKIVQSGGAELAEKLEKEGYGWLIK